MQTKMLNLHSIRQKVKSVDFNWLMFLLIVLFFIGLILGSFSVKSGNIASTAAGLTDVVAALSKYIINLPLFLMVS